MDMSMHIYTLASEKKKLFKYVLNSAWWQFLLYCMYENIHTGLSDSGPFSKPQVDKEVIFSHFECESTEH